MKPFLNTAIEKALNRYLSLDPESLNRMEVLEGKRITLELLIVSLKCHWVIKNGQMQAENEPLDLPDVTITGTPLSLLHMSVSKSNRKQFFQEGVSIEGDLELGQQIIDIFDEMEIDWEEHFSHVVGDVPAHQLGRFMRGVGDTVTRIRESFSQNINEYVHEEAELFPPQEALQDFFQDIDMLRMDADRLVARVSRLQKIDKESP